MDQQTLKILVAAIVCGLLLLVVARSAILRRRGVPVFAFTSAKNRIQKILVTGAAPFVLFLLLRPVVSDLDRLTKTGASPAPIAAVAVLLAACALIIAAQRGMGSSWRVGVPSAGGDIDALVTGGIYRFSRNPIYLGIMTLLLGVALAAPGPLTIVVALGCFICFSVIIADEETYLRSRFGEAYDSYCRHTRRWI